MGSDGGGAAVARCWSILSSQLCCLLRYRGALADREELVGLVEYVLARDPKQRPSLSAIRERVQAVQSKLLL